MNEKWRLGEDLAREDNLLDSITFDELIKTVHANCRKITPEAIQSEALTILRYRLEDMSTLLKRNLELIAEEAMKGRC